MNFKERFSNLLDKASSNKKFVFILLVVIAVALVFDVIASCLHRSNVESELYRIRSDISDIERDVNSLEIDVSSIKMDVSDIERTLRWR